MQVRANSLQELVYKQGQAGISKATVSIVFDNQDKERSPVGYEHLDEITVTRQLVIGGRSKYLINGKVAEPTYAGEGGGGQRGGPPVQRAQQLPAGCWRTRPHRCQHCSSPPHVRARPAGVCKTCSTRCSST